MWRLKEANEEDWTSTANALNPPFLPKSPGLDSKTRSTHRRRSIKIYIRKYYS